MIDPLAPKQLEFIINSVAHWNLAHGSVRSGKTIGTLFRFMQAANICPDSQIFMVGHSAETIYENAIRLLMESPQLSVFRPFCTWFPGKRQLAFKDKIIATLGAKDSGAIGSFQGKTMSLVYCDEMTLYPESIIDMIDTRLSNPWSMGFASMNPSHPNHKLKKWIDNAQNGDKNYYMGKSVLKAVKNTGKYTQTGKKLWVEKEYFWDPKKQGRQKTNSEFADDLQAFLEPYSIRNIYMDPSAEAMHVELRKRGMHIVHANNDVTNGISVMTSEMRKGNLFVCEECVNTIREIESYVWDSKAAERGDDEPLKKDDHTVDALRYIINTHKVVSFDMEEHNRKQQEQFRNRYQPTGRRF